MNENFTQNIRDAAERERAIDPSGSYIVQAPAGSGKTELLIRRFLVLLAMVERPEEILAITFTRKAAGEMHTRILDALVRASSGETGKTLHEAETLLLAGKVLTEDKKRGWGILTNPSRLRVQTIDSICMSLVKMMPLLSRTGAAPSVTENADEIYKEAARRVTALIEDEGSDGESVRQALRHMGNNAAELERRMVVIFKNRDQWLRHLKPPDIEGNVRLAREAIEGAVRAEVEEALHKASLLFTGAQVAELTECARFAAGNLLAAGKTSPVTALKDLKAAPGTRSSELKIWRGVASLLLTTQSEWRKPTARGITATIGFPTGKGAKGANVEFKERFIGLLTELMDTSGLLEALGELRLLPDDRFPEDEWETLGALLHLMPLSLGKLSSVFAEKGKVDFTSISMSALDALGTEEAPTDLMLQMDLRLKHLLVDEYQDTSFVHFGLLKALTSGWSGADGRTLFIVGDPMQSIYLFREAEVGLFLDAVKNGVGEVKLTPLVLRTNFRSSEDVVRWINSTFSKAFPDTGDIETGRVSYADADPFKIRTGVLPDTDPVTIRTGVLPDNNPSKIRTEVLSQPDLFMIRTEDLPDTDSANIPDEGENITVTLYGKYDGAREAEELVKTIGEIRRDWPDDTIAVLGRSRSHLVCIVELLNTYDVDFRTTDLLPLGTRPVVGDLFAITRALRHPVDRVAWLALLRAPFVGLALADIHALCLGDSSSPVSVLLSKSSSKDHISRLSEEGQERVLTFAAKMTEALTVRRRVRERTLVEGLWLSLGGPACLPDSDSASYAESYLDMLGKMEDASTGAIEEAVDKLFTGRSGVGDNPVEVMTMHKAKGLEYDHIFLPGLGKKPRTSEKSLLLWHEKRDALLLAPIEKKGGKRGKKGVGEKDDGDSGGGAIYKFIERKKKVKEVSEHIRLLYVAATRAKKGLYLFGHAKETEEGTLAPDKASLLSCISSTLTHDMLSPDSNRGDGEEVPSDKLSYNAPPSLTLKKLPAGWSLPEPPEPPDILRPVEDIEGEGAHEGISPVFDWSGEVARHIGTLVHAYFQRISRDGVSLWSSERVLGEKGRMEAMLRGEGLARAEAGKASGRCAEIIVSALGDDKAAWIFGGGKSGEGKDDIFSEGTEVSLSGLIGGRIVHRKIDRTFVDSDGVRWIIDYKTGTHEGGDRKHFFSEEKKRYAPQMEEYRALMHAIEPEREIRTALYYPALVRLIEV